MPHWVALPAAVIAGMQTHKALKEKDPGEAIIATISWIIVGILVFWR